MPTEYTMCREAVGEAANGQGKRRRHKVAYSLQKGISLGVKLAAAVATRRALVALELATGEPRTWKATCT